MGVPAIFAGQRTKLLSAKGLLLKDGTTIDNDGVVNFIKNNSGAIGTTGWTEGSYTAAARPSGTFTASSGAGSFAISTTTTTPLGSGTTSFLLTKTTGASRQGRAIETSFALPLSYRAKVLQLNIDYIINSGTFVAGSNSTDSSLIWYCAFSTDGGTTYTVAEPSSFKLLSNSTTISDKFSASIQTPSNATNMKLIAYVAESANSAWVVETIVAVSPSNYVYGTPVKDLAQYTASLSYGGTTATNISSQTYRWAQTGDRLSIEGTITFNGAANANGVFRIPLPPGLIVDTSKTSGAFQKLNGTVSFFQNSGSKFYGLGLPVLDGATNGGANNYFLVNSVTYNGLVFQQWQGSTTAISNNPTGAALASGDALEFSVSDIPILGWSSSVQVSDGYDGRVVAANVYRNVATANQSIPNATYTGVGFDSKNFDTTNDFTLSPSSNGSYFTVKSAGYYRVSASITFTSNGTNGRVLAIAKNTPSGVIEHLATSAGIAAAVTLSGTRTIYANADDKIYISAYQDSGAALNLAQLWNEASIEKLAGNPVISASELIAARYTTASGQAINNGASAVINFDTKVYDTHGAVTVGASWVFKAPTEGLYAVDVGTGSPAAANVFAANNVWQHILRKNQTGQYSYPGAFSVQASGSQSLQVNGSDTVYLLAGETIDLAVFNNTGVNRTLLTNAAANYISIKRVK